MGIRPIYLDYQATTPTDPLVIEAMNPWWHDKCGNPHSGDHWFGWTANEAVEEARRHVGELVGADDIDIVFTSGATESNNLAVIGAARAREDHRKKIVISAIEHKCVIESAAKLQRAGFAIEIAPVDRHGIVDLEALSRLVDEHTALVSVMYVNNEIGTVQPIQKVSELCAAVGAWFHSDSAQAPAAASIDVDALGIDLLSLSSHKIYGPMGIGALYARADIHAKIRPQSFGGGQEKGVRSGTVPTPLAVGFGQAAKLMMQRSKPERSTLQDLSTALWDGIRRIDPSVSLNGSRIDRHPGNLNVLFPDRDASALIGALQPHVAASTGSACTTGVPEPSHVLSALGLSGAEAESSVRFGVGRFTTKGDIERALTLIEAALKDVSRAVA